MILVALAALNFGAIRALWYDLVTGRNSNRLEVLGLGALPMANILAVGLWIGLRRRGSRPFLLGVELFGAVALALYLLVWTFYADEWVRFYLFRILNPLRTVVGYLDPPVVNKMFYFSVAAVVLGWPQMALALMGGFLFRKFRAAGRRGRSGVRGTSDRAPD